MKLRSLIIILFASLCITVKAQIADEIKSYVDSTEILFNNGRKMLLQSLIDSDYLKSGKIYFYLKDESSKKNCVAFNYWEEQSILALLSDWNSWLDHATNIEKWNSSISCYTYTEKMDQSLLKLEFAKSIIIRNEIDALTTDIEQKDLLELYFTYLTKGSKDKIYIKTYKSYKSKYKKKSRYFAFFNAYFPPINPDASITMSMGPTFVMPNGVLGDMFKTGTVFNLSYDFNIGNVYASLFMNGGQLPVKGPFYFTENETDEIISFNEGDKFSYVSGGLAAGYYLVRSSHVKIAPYLSIAGYTIESNLYPENSDKREVELVNSFSYGTGIHTEVKIVGFELKPNPLWYGGVGMPGATMQQYIGLKLDVGYDVVKKHVFKEITGNSSYVRVALVWGLGGF